MKFQAVQIRENNGKMLVKAVISAQFGSKWEGEVYWPGPVVDHPPEFSRTHPASHRLQVTIKNECTAGDFLKIVEEESQLKCKSYSVSFNGRLLRPENILYDIGIRDGKKVTTIPIHAFVSVSASLCVYVVAEVAADVVLVATLSVACSLSARLDPDGDTAPSKAPLVTQTEGGCGLQDGGSPQSAQAFRFDSKPDEGRHTVLTLTSPLP